MVTMTTTHDEKIMNFNIAEGYEAFMKLFDENEIAEMRGWLERDFGYDYSYETNEEANTLVIADYVKEMLVANIREDIIFGSRQLFDIVYNVCNVL